LSVRQIERLVQRYQAAGVAGLVSGKRGRPGNHQLSDGVARRALAVIRERYADFGPTLACEKLRECHGISLSVETVRALMMAARLWVARRDRPARIVAGENFGCGSSREAAVYALYDFGIRCVIAPSFGDIFRTNSYKNGLLLVDMSSEDIERLMPGASSTAGASLKVNLLEQTVQREEMQRQFSIAPFWKDCLLTGADDIDVTLRHQEAIAAFSLTHFAKSPWWQGRFRDFVQTSSTGVAEPPRHLEKNVSGLYGGQTCEI